MSKGRAEIQPELWVSDGQAALAFYERAFGAVVEHRVVGPGDSDLIAQLSVDEVEFIDSTGLRTLLWAAERSRANGNSLRMRLGSAAVRRMVELSGIESALPPTA